MRCPECGAIINAEDAHEIYSHPTESSLIQIYCRADCVLDALERGWPLKLWNLNFDADYGDD